MQKLQHKAIQIFLLTSTLPLIIVAVITLLFLHSIAIDNAKQSLTHYLNMSQSIIEDTYDNLRYAVRNENRKVYTLLEDNQPELLRTELKSIIEQNKIDFFIITDVKGKGILSIPPSKAEGDDFSNDYSVQKALKGEISVSTEILSERELENLGLTQRAKISGITPTQGLVIQAVLPVINREEKIIGTMSAGYLLNNNNRIIIDEIKRTTGLISSLLLNDLRVSSNVPSKTFENVIGTRLESKEIKMSLRQGKRHISRVRVLEQWYIAGYTPLYNGNKDIIGSFGIGIPETSIFALRNKLIRIFIIAVLLSMILALVIGVLNGGRIVISIKKLRRSIEAVTRGDFDQQANVNSNDEIEELANFFNQMLLQLKTAREQLHEYSKDLENKVAQRTAQLEAAHKQLLDYEKMAAIGRMATVLSHELKNVFAGVQTCAYYLKEKIIKDKPELVKVFGDIEYEVMYANNIISNILNFSRPRQLIFNDVNINSTLESTLTSFNLEKMFKDNNIEVIKDLDSDLPVIKADAVQIKEVILNLVINAAQAMAEGGKLTVITKSRDGFLRLEVIDTGGGISKEVLANLFNPFFTTKSKGLGLGLCIARDIVEAHKGRIEVQTQLNKGSTFIVYLPMKDIA